MVLMSTDSATPCAAHLECVGPVVGAYAVSQDGRIFQTVDWTHTTVDALYATIPSADAVTGTNNIWIDYIDDHVLS
jgi:hypothetical protein